MKLIGLDTVTSTVADLDRALEFYTRALGFEAIAETTFTDGSFPQLAGQQTGRVRVATLQLGNERIELLQCLDLAPQPFPTDPQSNDLWFQHFAVVVRDMDRAYDRLQAFAIAPISSAPQTIPAENPMAGGVRAFKFRDPDRHPLELIWFPPDKGKAKWQQGGQDLFLGIDHTAIAVADTEASLKFYRDLLGMTVAGSNLNAGDIQAQLDGLPTARVQVTPLQPAETGMGLELLGYIEPGPGRAVPDGWNASHLAYRHIVLAVDGLDRALDYLQQRAADGILSQPIILPTTYRYGRGCLVRGPSGHSLLLVSA